MKIIQKIYKVAILAALMICICGSMFSFNILLADAKEQTKFDYVFQNNDYLFGNQLDEDSQYYYLILLKKLKVATEKEFTISLEDRNEKKISDSLNNALNAIFFDFPDYQWLKLGDKKATYFIINYVNGIATKVVFYPVIKEEYKNTDAISEELDKVEDTLDAIINKMPKAYETRYERLKYIHDYLVKSVIYDTTQRENKIHSASGALLYQRSVCEGYAKAFKMACEKMGVPSQLATSDTHMWNYVQMEDGNWYIVDVTFDDPLLNGTSDYKDGKNLSYTYFLVGEKSVAGSKDHKVKSNTSSGGVTFTLKTLSKENYNKSNATKEKQIIYKQRFSERFIKDLTKPLFYTSNKTLLCKQSYTQRIKKLSKAAKVTYHSSKVNVAKVNEKGKIIAMGKGTCVITTTVKQGGKTYIHKLNLTVQDT